MWRAVEKNEHMRAARHCRLGFGGGHYVILSCTDCKPGLVVNKDLQTVRPSILCRPGVFVKLKKFHFPVMRVHSVVIFSTARSQTKPMISSKFTIQD